MAENDTQYAVESIGATPSQSEDVWEASLGRNSVVIQSRSALAKHPVGFGSTASILNSAKYQQATMGLQDLRQAKETPAT